jgi:hypothetical protein
MVAGSRKSINQRGKSRITRVLPVDCRVVELPLQKSGQSLADAEQSFGGRTINLSEDGLLINTDFFLDPKTKIEVSFTLPDNGKKLKLLAQVARSQKNAFNLYGRYGVGLHLLEIPKEYPLLTSYFSDGKK